MKIARIPWEQTIDIRHEMLWPDKPRTFCQVEGDEQAAHYGCFVEAKLVCVASVFVNDNQARLRKFATLESHQHQGIGSTMLNHILEELTKQTVSLFWFDARESALGFYRKFGFEPEGNRFFKGDIPYVKMAKRLGPE